MLGSRSVLRMRPPLVSFATEKVPATDFGNLGLKKITYGRKYRGYIDRGKNTYGGKDLV